MSSGVLANSLGMCAALLYTLGLTQWLYLQPSLSAWGCQIRPTAGQGELVPVAKSRQQLPTPKNTFSFQATLPTLRATAHHYNRVLCPPTLQKALPAAL